MLKNLKIAFILRLSVSRSLFVNELRVFFLARHEETTRLLARTSLALFLWFTFIQNSVCLP